MIDLAGVSSGLRCRIIWRLSCIIDDIMWERHEAKPSSRDAAPVCPSIEEKQTVSTPPARILKACPPKVRRGALGFRARQTRKQQYSVVKQQVTEAPSQGRPKPKSKRKNSPKTKDTQVE
jgi:hypothetical protein